MKVFDSRLCFWDGYSVQYLYILGLPLYMRGKEIRRGENKVCLIDGAYIFYNK